MSRAAHEDALLRAQLEARTRQRVAQVMARVPDADAILVSAPVDIRWLTGFTGSNGLVVMTREGTTLLTDGRYTEQAAREVAGPKVQIVSGDLLEIAARNHLDGVRSVAVQQDALTLSRARDLFAMPHVAHVQWLEQRDLVRECRLVKDAQELALIQAAQRLTEAVFHDILGDIQAGITEQELAAKIVYGHLRGGASSMAFEPIVASGPNAALPHARPTNRPLAEGELVLFDMGCFLNGYASDMTRMVSIGDPGARAAEVHNTVQRALAASLDAARAGLTSKELDESARSVIPDAGFGPQFSHSLGHGVGLEVHEGPPVSFRSEQRLRSGSVITLEPGIYLPGELGVRIEDMVLLTEAGCDRITSLPHELTIV